MLIREAQIFENDIFRMLIHQEARVIKFLEEKMTLPKQTLSLGLTLGSVKWNPTLAENIGSVSFRYRTSNLLKIKVFRHFVS